MRRMLVPLVALGMTATLAGPVLAQEPQVCDPVDTSTREVLPGVVLTWDSSFLCSNAATRGSYAIRVTVANHATSDEAVTIRSLALSHTTPRPRGRGPDASATASGLPLRLASGQSGAFDVRGRYELVTTDEGKKANLHLRARGVGEASRDRFTLGINVMLRGPGAVEQGDGKVNGGSVRGGPPAWVETGRPHRAGRL